jgi:hypothetical protein
VLRAVLDPDSYPLATRVGTAAGTAQRGAYESEHAYRFGLQLILDGLAALIGAADGGASAGGASADGAPAGG